MSDLPFPLIWRVAFSLIGIGLSFWGMKISINAFEFQFRQVENDKDNWVKLLSRVPPFTVGIIGLLMGLISPLDLKWSMSLAVASFFALLWMFNLHAWSQSSNNKELVSAISLNRHVFWLASGAMAFIFLLVILAPGIGSFQGYN